MVNVHDCEIFKNFFSTTAKNVETGEVIQYYIHQDVNQLDEIVNMYSQENHWWVGYNSTAFDDPLIQYILDRYEMFKNWSSDDITGHLMVKASEIIDDKKSKYTDVSFHRFDLMRVAGLYKSLKLVAVNLKHNKIQDLPYKFDSNVQIDQVQEILDYNLNDVEITLKLYKDQRDEILLRQSLTSRYGINLMNESRSGVANKILEKDYAIKSGQRVWDFKNRNTTRDVVHFEDIISDKISFNSKNLQNLLQDIKDTYANKDSKVEFHALIGDTRYDILKGGIHSNMPPNIYQTDEDGIIKDADVSSYYPRIMINLGIKPEHLHDCFLPLLEDYTDTRLKAKAEGDKVAADGLKIVINSIYGKMGFEHHWLYDLQAMYEVTLNGQLFLLMLIERLEEAGIPVFYANTDGITAKVPYGKQQEYYDICQKWQNYTEFELEFEDYSKCVIRDVNNYIWIPQDELKKNKYKGFFDIKRWKDVTKAFDKPIVPLAVYKYFTEDEPVEKTIRNHKDIFDFCMAQKTGKKFEVFHEFIEDGNLVTDSLQDTNRYYVGKGGGRIYKQEPGSSKQTALVAGDPVWILNDIHGRSKDLYPVKDRYYIAEANKVINIFNDKQMNLF